MKLPKFRIVEVADPKRNRSVKFLRFLMLGNIIICAGILSNSQQQKQVVSHDENVDYEEESEILVNLDEDKKLSKITKLEGIK